MNLLKKIWAEEPVITRVGLALAVSAGVLTATQASTVGDLIAALVSAVGAFSARSKVTPAANIVRPATDHTDPYISGV